jgi:Tetratricopeptide repeat
VEPNSNIQIGSVVDIRDRLLLWANRSIGNDTNELIGSLIRAEFSSEFSRQRVVAELRTILADRSIPFHELVLPSQQDPLALTDLLVAQVASLPAGVLSVTGFATAFNNQVPVVEAMRVLNFNRDRLVANSLCQIWWMTPFFAQTAIYAMPDITSWFIAKLQLTEYPQIDTTNILTEKNSGGVYANIDDARRRAQNFLQRMQAAQEAGVDDSELLETFLLPALEALSEVGAQKSLHDLSLQFEGLLGKLKLTNSVQVAIALDRIAILYENQGRYSEAEPLCVRSLTIREEQLGANHPDTAASLNNLAGLYSSMGRYLEAEPLYVRSLAIREEQLGTNHPDTAASLNNLAGLYEFTGRYLEAEPLYVRSLAIREEQLGTNHPSTATGLNNLAEFYRVTGRYSEAEPLYVRSLAIREEQQGTNHPDTATGLNNLAEFYRITGRYSEAEPLYVRSLAIAEEQLDSNHPFTAISMNNLALLYESTGRYSEAEPLYVRSLAIREEQRGANHPSIATSMNNLALLYESTGRYSEAEPLYVRSLQIAENTLGKDHPTTQTIRKNLEMLRQQLSKTP